MLCLRGFVWSSVQRSGSNDGAGGKHEHIIIAKTSRRGALHRRCPCCCDSVSGADRDRRAPHHLVGAAGGMLSGRGANIHEPPRPRRRRHRRSGGHLGGALNYVATRPRYRSAYYPSGYPDDGYGVCADVVAFALRDAGYDLQSLVAVDVAASPGAYGIEDPDSAIDFRRVRNLRVYCERHAQSLTCDTDDVEAWQGGDIVVYDGHVGIVSDRRDARGMPFLIHHASPFQLAYEEDRLDSYGTIIGHYRM